MAKGRGDVVAQGDVHLGQDQFPGRYIFFAGVGRQNFLRYGLRFGHFLRFQFRVLSFEILLESSYPAIIKLARM